MCALPRLAAERRCRVQRGHNLLAAAREAADGTSLPLLPALRNWSRPSLLVDRPLHRGRGGGTRIGETPLLSRAPCGSASHTPPFASTGQSQVCPARLRDGRPGLPHGVRSACGHGPHFLTPTGRGDLLPAFQSASTHAGCDARRAESLVIVPIPVVPEWGEAR